MAAANITSKCIVIDTTDYAGNFERELCAFVTGQYGECSVGREIAAESASEISYIAWWTKHVRMEADEYGCRRPVSIYATPGWFNNGMGCHYPDDPAFYQAAIADATKAAEIYAEKHSQHILKRLADNDFAAEGPGAWTKEACEQALERSRASVRAVAEQDFRFPANLSVAIFVDEFPDDMVFAEMKLRAQLFCDNYPYLVRPWDDLKKINLTGFRKIDNP